MILKSVDKDPVANRLLHVAVLEVSQTDVVIVEVPIHFVGTPAPVEQKEGTVLHPTTHLKVRGQIQDLPDSLEIDISGLEMNHSASVSDLTISDKLEVLTPLDATIATIAPIVVQFESEAEPTEGGAEPELVGGESEGESDSGGEAAPGRDSAEPSIRTAFRRSGTPSQALVSLEPRRFSKEKGDPKALGRPCEPGALLRPRGEF